MPGFSEKLTERDTFENLDIDGRVILKWILKKYDGRGGAGLN
jgi:hypothetical protein